MEKNHEECCEPAHTKTEEAQPKNLDTLKEEILKEIKQGKRKRISWASATVTAILVVLAFISITQAVQMASIWKKIQGGAIKPASANTAPAAPLPSSVQNLPNMVGGC